MFFEKKWLLLKTTGILALTNFLVFMLFYVFTYLVSFPPMLYVLPFISDLATVAIPAITATVMFVYGCFEGLWRGLLFGLLPSVTRIFYLILYYYLLFIRDGFDSVESILFSLLSCIPEIIFLYIITALIYFALHFITMWRAGDKDTYVFSLMGERLFDFDNPISFSALLVAIGSFLYLIIVEIIDTVAFFSEYGSNFNTFEIVYIAISFLVDLAIGVLIYLGVELVRKKIVTDRVIFGV